MTELLAEAFAKLQQLPDTRQDEIARFILEQIEPRDFWSELNEIIEECQMETGINDLSYQHDHYLYGTPKREVE